MSLDDFNRDIQHIHDRAYARQSKIKLQGILQRGLFEKTKDFNRAWDSWRASRNRVRDIQDGAPENNGFEPDYRKIILTILTQVTSIGLAAMCVFSGSWIAAISIMTTFAILNLLFLRSF
jgi:hypothetical protein